MTDRERLFNMSTSEARPDLFLAWLSGYFANDEYILGKLAEAMDDWEARNARINRIAGYQVNAGM